MNGDDDKRGENREMTREKAGRSKKLLLLPPDDGGDGESGGDNVRRLAYRKRLETFSAATYFAKPAELSPIVCARFGWENVGCDMLACATCRAVWAVQLPAVGLPVLAERRLAQLYHRQLATAHKETCPYRKEAMSYIEEEEGKKVKPNASNNRTMMIPLKPLVPTLLAGVLPIPQVEIFEYPYNPWRLLRKQWKEFMTIFVNMSLSDAGEGQQHYRIPVNLKVPSSVLEHNPCGNAEENVQEVPLREKGGTTLLGRVTDMFLKNCDEDGNENENNQLRETSNDKESSSNNTSSSFRKSAEAATALVLLGWKPLVATEKQQQLVATQLDEEKQETLTIEENNHEQKNTITVGCPLCMAKLELKLQQQSSKDDDDAAASLRVFPPLRKRPRNSASTDSGEVENNNGILVSVLAHRHYCPYLVGFVNSPNTQSTPLWQSIASRLLSLPLSFSPNESSMATSVEMTSVPYLHDNENSNRKGLEYDEGCRDDSVQQSIRSILQASISPMRKTLKTTACVDTKSG